MNLFTSDEASKVPGDSISVDEARLDNGDASGDAVGGPSKASVEADDAAADVTARVHSPNRVLSVVFLLVSRYATSRATHHVIRPL